MLSGRGLCDELITRPEVSYRLCCVVVCDLETSRIGAPYIYDISNLRVNLLGNKIKISAWPSHLVLSSDMCDEEEHNTELAVSPDTLLALVNEVKHLVLPS